MTCRYQSASVKYSTEKDRPRGAGLNLVASRGTWVSESPQIVHEIRGCWCLHSPFRLTAIPETDSLSLTLPEGAVKFKRRPDHGPRPVVDLVNRSEPLDVARVGHAMRTDPRPIRLASPRGSVACAVRRTRLIGLERLARPSAPGADTPHPKPHLTPRKLPRAETCRDAPTGT